MIRRRPRIFTATRLQDVPRGCARYISVDGAVPGASRCFDHHQSGEPINLDTLPDRLECAGIDLAQIDGIGTTLADTDALVSVVTLLLGGRAFLPAGLLAVFQAASHRCDHLRPHPRVSGDPDDAGRRLDNHVGATLAATPPSRRSRAFARLCREVLAAIQAGDSLPGRDDPAWAEDVAAVERAGHLRFDDPLLVVDLRRHRRLRVRPDAWYLHEPRCRAALIAENHPRGGIRYTIGRNPFSGAVDMLPVLAVLAAAEFAHGPPALGPQALPGNENWGGRRDVGGSPWNYGSRLGIHEAVSLVRRALG
jgi:hypothetical protein